MRAQVGNLLVIESRHVGGARREGEILEVMFGGEGEHYRVLWSSGEESIFFPQSDCRVSAGDTPIADVDLRPSAMTRHHGDVDVWFEENETHTEARMTIQVRDNELTGTGRAERHPNDPSQPAIGEELAAARAMSDLAHQLLDLATNQLEELEGHPVHVQL